VTFLLAAELDIVGLMQMNSSRTKLEGDVVAGVISVLFIVAWYRRAQQDAAVEAPKSDAL
jgi:hypothetical protein